MESFNTLQEVISYAIEREEESYRLYMRASGMVEAVSSRKMLEEMAAQELVHKQLLQRMDTTTAQFCSTEKVPDLKIGDYLVDVKYRDDMTYQEILIFAMKMEEKAAQLYASAHSLTSDERILKMLEMLVNEEKKHKFNIEALYNDKVLAEN